MDMTIEEASEFWDTHSVADYPSHVVQSEYRPEEQITFVAIANDLLRQLEKQAKKQGASICTVYFHFRSLTLSGANKLCRL